jgi:hypothetical protein
MISPISVEMKTVNGCFVVMATAFTPAQGILALKWAMEPVNGFRTQARWGFADSPKRMSPPLVAPTKKNRL